MNERLITWINYIISIIIGVILSSSISFAIICTLYEISQNSYYSFFFIFIFIFISWYIFFKSYRNYITKFQHIDFIQVEQRDKLRYYYLITLGFLLLLSGVFTFLLQLDFVSHANYKYKIVLFCVIGLGITFAVVISLIDVINLLVSLCFGKDKNFKPPIYSGKQIIPLIMLTCAIGLFYGGVFGVMDIEDVKISKWGVMIMKDERIILPVAIIGGIIAGIIVNLKDTREDDDDDNIIVEKGFSPLAQEEEI